MPDPEGPSEDVRDREQQPTGPSAAVLAAVVASAPDGVVMIDAGGRILEFNAAAEHTFAYRRAQVLGSELADLLIPPALRERHRLALREFRGKRPGSILDRRIETLGMRSDGVEFPLELTVSQVSEDPVVFGAFVRDLTQRQRAAAAKDLLAAASAAFDASLDPLQTMRTIAHSAVPQLAELCVIDLVRADGTIGDSVVAARDARVTSRLEELRARQPLQLSGTHPVARALRTGDPVVVHDLTDPTALAEVAQSEEHRSFMQEVGYSSAVVIKLTARNRLLGTISFLHMNGGGRFESEDLGVIQDLAKRAAMALDNANLYAERTHVARTLQRSLLPEALPSVDGVELACAYRPVGESAEVGGDFYDVFEAPSGCWLVVGDVCGKGTEAAAVTALVRHSIRALALRQSSPATVLSSANEVMLSHDLSGRFATAILVRLDLAGDRPLAVVASAGHPPPIVLEPGGGAHALETNGTLLGVLPELRTDDLEVRLAPGTNVILYTDGLTDAGAPLRELEPADLCRHLEANASADPGVLVSGLEALSVSQAAGRLRDDIAILAARVGA